MKFKYTPGPWIVIDERTTSGHPIKAIRRGDGKSVYNIAILGDRMPSAAQWQPNAQLIAAAPELLGALETLRFALTDDVSNNDGRVDFAACYEILNKAIAKARGE